MNKPTVRKRKWNRAAVLSLFTLSAASASAQSVLYWDSNDTLPGAGITPTGTWGSSSFWSTDLNGGAPTLPWTSTTDIAVFSAGSDATGPFTLTVSATQTAASVLVEEGTINLVAGGVIDTGTGTFTIGTGAGSTARLNMPALGVLNAGGKVVLDGGALFSSNTSSGSTFMSGAKLIEVTANGGFVGYDDGVAGNLASSLYAGTILGAGGTVSVPAGTLTKIGPDEFRAQNSGMANNTFAKLVVKQGLYRLGNVSGANFETAFGGVPTAVLADAITLDGGQIGTSVSIALHANRGITITPAGGTFNGAGVLTVPGPLTGSGKLTVISGGGVNLGNAGNVNTFTGSVEVNAGTLTLAQSLNATNIIGTGGIVSVSSSRIFNVGSDNTSTTYAGVVAGAGQFTKSGTGVLGIRAEWTNTGATNITNGTVRFEISAAGLGNSSQVNVGAAGILDANNVNDSIGSLVGAGSIINGANLTLTGNNSTSANFSGSFSGTAASRVLTKAGSVVDSLQILSGTNDFTAVNFTGGDFRLNSNTALNGAGGPTPITVAVVTAPAVDNTGASSIGVSAGTVDIPNAITLNSSLKIHATSGNTARFNGVISGVGGLLRDNFGAGSVFLNGANTFQGGVKVAGRNLSLGNKSALGTGTLTLGDATTAPAGAINIVAATSLSGTEAITNPVVVNRDFTLGGDNLEFTSVIDLGAVSRTVTANNAAGKSAIFSGNVIGAGGSLVKAGTGTLTLSGAANTYTGATTVNAGTLLANGNILGTSAVTVAGILGGIGSISPALDGSITLSAGGKIAPGASAGTLTVSLTGTGIFDLRAGIDFPTGALQFELGTPLASDKIALSGGPLEIGSAFLNFDDFAFTALAGFGQGDYLLFDTSSTISGLLGTNLTGNVNGFDAEIQLADGGKDLVLHVVPEPGSFAIKLGGFAVLVGRRKRR